MTTLWVRVLPNASQGGGQHVHNLSIVVSFITCVPNSAPASVSVCCEVAWRGPLPLSVSAGLIVLHLCAPDMA